MSLNDTIQNSKPQNAKRGQHGYNSLNILTSLI